MSETPPEPGPSAPPSPTRTNLDPLARIEVGSVLADRYEIRKMLGMGGMGLVYRAHDRQLGIDVALKLLRPELAGEPKLIERFRQELRLARQVSHRNVVRIHDIGQAGDLYFLTMDFVPGRSLREVIEADGQVDPQRARSIAEQLASALHAAHAEGVIHRDLKPSNVMVDEDDRAFITDFGVARSVAGAGMTRTGAIVGTPDYLSPEQARGEPADARSDLYSLGTILFEMITGQLPFQGGSYAETLAQRISSRPRDLAELQPDVPKDLRAIVTRLLETSPQRRFQSGEEVASALRGETEVRMPFPWRAAAAAVGVALLLAGGWIGARWALRPGAAGDPPLSGEVAPLHSIAVLPFLDETGQARLAWTATGVAEMLAEGLANSAELRVIEPGRVFQTLNDLKLPRRGWSGIELRQAADVFRADRLISGRVRSVGDELRVDLDWIESTGTGDPTRTPLASESFPIEDLATVVSRLESAARDRLAIPLSDEPVVALAEPEAVAAYSRGLQHLFVGDAVAAAPEFEHAVTASPEFAQAWVRLAEAYRTLGYQDRAAEAAERGVGAVADTSSRVGLEARAQQAILRSDWEAAGDILRELVSRYPNDIEPAVNLADALGDQGRHSDAIAELERVVEIDPSHPRAWYLLAKNAISIGDTQRAIDEYLVQALVLQNKLGNRQGRADVVNALGVAYLNLGEFAQAEEQLRRAAELRREIGDDRGYATSISNLALILAWTGQYDEARQRLEEGRAIFEKIGDQEGAARSENHLGVLEEERGRYAEALSHYRRALQIRRELGDRSAVGESLLNVGYAYLELGEYENARVYSQQALDVYRGAQNRDGELAAIQNLGFVDTAVGRWDSAVRRFLDSLTLARELGDDAATAVAHGELGRLAHLQGRYAAALESYAESEAVLTGMGDVGDLRGLTEYALGRAAVLLDLGMLAEARSALSEAESRLEQSTNHEQAADLARLLGRLAAAQESGGAVRAALTTATREAEASENGPTILRVRAWRMLLEPGRGTAEAEVVISEADALGNALLRLESREAAATRWLATGDAESAARAAQRGLRIAAANGAYGGTYRLQALLARARTELGEADAAAEALRASGREIERLRAELDDDQRASFDRRVDVRRVLDSGVGG